MFVRRPESGAPARTNPADRRILEYIKIYEADSKPDIVERCRKDIITDVLERHKESGFLLEVREREMLKDDEIIHPNVLRRLKKVLEAKS